MSTTNNITEAELAQVSGVSRDDLVKLRMGHLSKGFDWEKSGREIVYTDAGRARLAGLLKLATPPDGSTPPPDPLALPWRAEPVELVVVRLPVNTRLVLASNGTVDFRVRVRSSANFRRGMTIMAKPIDEESGLYELVGRLPRWPGRW